MKTKSKVADVAGTAKPYVERALHDEELRDHVKQAYTAARDIYEQLIGPRGVAGIASRVAGDDEIRDSLRTTVEELRQAANRLQGRREERRAGRNILLLLIGVILGLLYNPLTGPGLRSWLKEQFFGGDEFGFENQSGNGAGN